MSQTSVKAFQEISEQLPEKRRIVYSALKSNPNNSFYRIAFILGWNVNKVSNRFNELENAGLIEKTGEETRGKFTRDRFSAITDVDRIIEKQNNLYVSFVDIKAQLETDYHRCQTKEGKELLAKRVQYLKTKISNLKMASI
jgi:DNA-binding transcriptional regulator YhcF (GntR family)